MSSEPMLQFVHFVMSRGYTWSVTLV